MATNHSFWVCAAGILNKSLPQWFALINQNHGGTLFAVPISAILLPMIKLAHVFFLSASNKDKHWGFYKEIFKKNNKINYNLFWSLLLSYTSKTVLVIKYSSLKGETTPAVTHPLCTLLSVVLSALYNIF